MHNELKVQPKRLVAKEIQQTLVNEVVNTDQQEVLQHLQLLLSN